MQHIRKSRVYVLLATWVSLTRTSLGSSGLLHPEDGLDMCAATFVDHDSADHHVTGQDGPDAPGGGHCDICHLLRSLRPAPAMARVGYTAPVSASHAIGVDTHARIDSRVRYRLPSRSPPA